MIVNPKALSIPLSILYTHARPGGKRDRMSYQILFEQQMPLGHLTAVSLPEPATKFPDCGLEPEERDFALEMHPRRRGPWIGGRLALKNSLKHLGAPIVPILSTPRGAPELPPGFVGSISHKKSLAVCLVSRDTGWTVGVDLEPEIPPREGIESMILTEEENEEVQEHPSDVRWKETLLRFSLKESIYKAIDPHVRRFVGFQEVRVHPTPEGTALVHWQLKKMEGPFEIETHWRRQEGYYITSVRVRNHHVPR